MLIMCLVFIILFSVSVAALAITSSQQETLLKKAWGSFSNGTKNDVQNFGNCCGFENMNDTSDHPSCSGVHVQLNLYFSPKIVVSKLKTSKLVICPLLSTCSHCLVFLISEKAMTNTCTCNSVKYNVTAKKAFNQSQNLGFCAYLNKNVVRQFLNFISLCILTIHTR